MNPIAQFLASLAGGLTALKIICVLSRKGREHVVVFVCVAVGIGFVLPVPGHFSKGVDHALLMLVLLGTLFAGAGLCVGGLVERWLKARRKHG